MAQRNKAARRSRRPGLPAWRARALAMAALMAGAAAAQPAVPAQAGAEAAAVYTRARLVSVEREAGNKLYVRLRLLPRAKLPFTTQTLRVTDGALLAGIPPGAWVKFTARHVDAQNTLTSIHVVPECKRFQHCD
jgi:Cu/Ag efflux protein CusF